MELYLIIYNVETKTEFKKYFKCEYLMDKFKRKLTYSSKLFVVKDSREEYLLD